MTSVDILQRIDAIRRSENLVYQLSPQAIMDRCEAIFEEALEKGRFEAAVAAMRLQAKVGGLLRPDAPAAAQQDIVGVVEHCVRTAVSRYVAFGTMGALNPLTPPPWPAGDEAARRTRRNMKKELDADPPPVQPPGPRNDEDRVLAAQTVPDDPQTPEELAREDAIWRARHGWPRRERAYRLGRTPEPGKPERGFPPEDDEGGDAPGQPRESQ